MTQQNPASEKRYAMPVGTSSLIELSRFIFEERDTTCMKCKSGYKSVAPKSINGVVYQVPLICPCVPYVASQDKDGNFVMVYKGVRELWPGKKRPEQYIQNDMQRTVEFDRAKKNLSEVRSQAKAHDGVTAGKYTLGVFTSAEQGLLGKDMVKALTPKFSHPGEAQDPNDVKEFVQHKTVRRVAMRNKEGHIIMVDDATALNMRKKGIAVPERPVETVEKSAPEAKGKEAQASVDGQPVAPVTGVAVKRGRGRPAGSKNKPKPPKE
ncbi:Uncharacterised protein [uncultured archaeon]|nr:Uncharacterised protein [uncultured archaeon]